MQLEGCLPDKVTLITVLGSCANEKSGSEGKQIHSSVVGSQFKEDVNVCNSIVSMYAKSGESSSARKMFEKMIKIDVISCNTMISCLMRNMCFDQAILIFQQMWQQGIRPSEITFATVFAGCAEQKAITLGRTLHACIVEMGHTTNLAVGNAILSMYGKCGSLDDAWRLFHVFPERDMVSWTIIITAYAVNGHGFVAFELLDMMRSIMALDNGAFISIVSALNNYTQRYDCHVDMCDRLCKGDRNEVFDILILVQKIFDTIERKDIAAWNVIIAAHAQMGDVVSALQLSAKFLEKTVLPDPHMCTSVLSFCSDCRALVEGMCIHSLAVENDIEVDTTMGNALLDLYGKCGCMEDAEKLFGSILQHDVVTWTMIVGVYALNGKGQVVLQLYQQMLLEGAFPDKVIFLSIFSACSSYNYLLQGMQMHNQASSSIGSFDSVIGNGLINMYAKCGDIWMARKSFDSMQEKVVSSWNTMISGYAQNGLYEDALALFWLMQQENISPNTISLVSVLSACTHGGMIFEAFYLFASMPLDNEIYPELEHYNSMIDMVGKAGRLDVAEDVIRNMPYQPTLISWMSLLSACKYQLDFGWAVQSVWFALELDCNNLAPYVVLANMNIVRNELSCDLDVRTVLRS